MSGKPTDAEMVLRLRYHQAVRRCCAYRQGDQCGNSEKRGEWRDKCREDADLGSSCPVVDYMLRDRAQVRAREN